MWREREQNRTAYEMDVHTQLQYQPLGRRGGRESRGAGYTGVWVCMLAQRKERRARLGRLDEETERLDIKTLDSVTNFDSMLKI